MKVIFLDVDGVLNNIKNTVKVVKRNRRKGMPLRSNSFYFVPFDRRCLKNLARIVRRTKAKIVVTSTWRRGKEDMAVLESRLAEYGMVVTDTTKVLGARGAEIKDWIKEHEVNVDPIKFVVLDDDTYDIDNFLGTERVIETDGKYGLTFSDSLKAIDILNEGVAIWKK